METMQTQKTRTLGTHALCAKEIRKDLKKVFPKIKFGVTSAVFSMGNSVDVRWTDGPTRDQVEGVIKKYQYGHFDGMTDYYEYSNSREDLPQAKYVMADRTLSEEAIKEFAKEYSVKWDLNEPVEDIHKSFDWHNEFISWNQLAWKELYEVVLK